MLAPGGRSNPRLESADRVAHVMAWAGGRLHAEAAADDFMAQVGVSIGPAVPRLRTTAAVAC
jgi:hypothetical protein